MRIGVDGTSVANERGYGRFTREILGALVRLAPEESFIVFVDSKSAPRLEAAPNVEPRVVPLSEAATSAASAEGYRSPRDLLRMKKAVSKEALDVFFAPTVYTYFPLPRGLPAVVTIHDAIAERYPKLTLPTWRARLFWKIKVSVALRQSRLVLTVSEFAAREIVEVLRIPKAKVRVAVEAPSPAYRPENDSAKIAAASSRAGVTPGEKWFSYVGGFNPHKNLPTLLEAHAKVAAAHLQAPHLLLTGPGERDNFHGDVARLKERVLELGTKALVHWTGFLPDEELRLLHSGTVALVLPSECEGFGLPAVEAAACGAPVIATTRSPLPELLEGGGVFVAPRDVDGLVRAMNLLLDDEPVRAACARRALEGARRLSWEEGARITLSALREAAA